MNKETYNFLLVDDDKKFIERYKRFEKEEKLNIASCNITWNFCTAFEDSFNEIHKNYDLIICDVLNSNRKDEGVKTVKKIKQSQLCPIIMFSNGGSPEYIQPPFISFVSKVHPKSRENLINEIKKLINFGVVSIRKKLIKEIISEIDKSCCDFAWNYIENNWENIKKDFTVKDNFDAGKLKAVIKRRIGTKILHQSKGNSNLYEYYLFPVKDKKITLGTIIKYINIENKKEKIGVVLTPHCHFEKHGDKKSKINSFLVTNCLHYNNLSKEKQDSAKNNVRRVIQIPITAGKFTPEGRYCFLPHLPGEFDDDLFCDLNDLAKLPLPESSNSEQQDTNCPSYEILAQVLPPYAEALQSAFVRYYASVGTPNLDPEDFKYSFPHEHEI